MWKKLKQRQRDNKEMPSRPQIAFKSWRCITLGEHNSCNLKDKTNIMGTRCSSTFQQLIKSPMCWCFFWALIFKKDKLFSANNYHTFKQQNSSNASPQKKKPKRTFPTRGGVVRWAGRDMNVWHKAQLKCCVLAAGACHLLLFVRQTDQRSSCFQTC